MEGKWITKGRQHEREALGMDSLREREGDQKGGRNISLPNVQTAHIVSAISYLFSPLFHLFLNAKNRTVKKEIKN